MNANQQQSIAATLLGNTEKVTLKAGSIVKVGGFPFRLVNDTVVEGKQENLTLSHLGSIGGDFPG